MRNINNLKKALAFLTAAGTMAAYLAGCSEATNTDKANTESSVTEALSSDEETGESLTADTMANVKSSSSHLFSSRDLDPSYDEITETITLGSENVTITEEGVYLIKGTLKDGQIIVNAPKAKVQLVLDGAVITCSDSSAIYVQDADKVFITLAEGSENTVTDGKTYADAEDENAPSAAIFSEDSLTINGSGSLTVNGNYKNGIQSKDDIVITGGTIKVTAVNHGIKGKDYVAIADGDSNIDAGSDGIKSTNAVDEGMGFVYIEGGKFDITAVNDGIQAETVLTVTDGTFDILSGGGYEKSSKTHTDNFGGGGMFGGHGGFGNKGDFGEMPDDFGQMPDGGFGGRGDFGQEDVSETDVSFTQLADLTVSEAATSDDTASVSTKGLKAGTEINISGGTFNIDAADDTIHSDGDINITGGIFTINAGDDGIHSDATVNIGEKAENDFETVQIFIANCYEGIEGVTINQNSGTVYIISGDDGYNAAGGALDTTTENNFGHGGMMSTSTGTLNINGGLVVVNSANGDHDAFDSNGDINLNGGYICANGQDPLDFGDYGNAINYNGTSVITMTAGNTDLSQRYSFVDDEGNVIVSFMSANGNAGQNCTDCKAYSGGTVSGGTEVLAQADKYAVTFGGTLKDGTEITAEAETGGMFGGGFGGGMKGGRQFAENGEMPDGIEPPTGEDGRPQMPDGMEPPTDENGEIQMPESGFGGGHRGGEMRRQQTTEENSAN